MAEYIDRDQLQTALARKKSGPANGRYTEGWNDCLMRVKSMVSTAPAADVAPVSHSYWGGGIPVHSTWVRMNLVNPSGGTEDSTSATTTGAEGRRL